MGVMLDDPRAEALAGELAALTGEDVTDAVIKALEERLAREEARRKKLADLREIAKRFREAAPRDLTSDHSFLYDEHGLPK